MLYAQLLSYVRLAEAPWTVAHQDLLSMEFPRQEYWSGLLFPTPGDLTDPGIKPGSPVFPASAGGFFTTSATWEVLLLCMIIVILSLYIACSSHLWVSVTTYFIFPLSKQYKTAEPITKPVEWCPHKLGS